jgi:hypothetical protein
MLNLLPKITKTLTDLLVELATSSRVVRHSALASLTVIAFRPAAEAIVRTEDLPRRWFFAVLVSSDGWCHLFPRSTEKKRKAAGQAL